ncbi:MAG: BolA/IbaG family iron-sulfur metabolism protein [Candidatus Omnitrophota bacterium]|nr:BolA/IbaG family iron-sulfur metabolism protein [Candidatus Omnitrophota bacterium]MDZ4242629.1 BolA/IbaG family iron-sulfur metabolism protein [Candidatus Omnitrophota bacterium]
MAVRPEEIQDIIERAVPQARAHVLDPMGDGEHLQAIVISPAFEGMPLVRQHQMVMKALKGALAQALHALALKTFTPEQWEQSKKQFPSLNH